MNKLCPKCNEPYDRATIFGDKDNKDICGMVTHGIKRVMETHFGITQEVERFDKRCYLSFDELKQIYPSLYICEECGIISTKDKPRCSHAMSEEQIEKKKKSMDEDWERDFFNEVYNERIN